DVVAGGRVVARAVVERVEGGERVEGARQAAVAVDGGGRVDEPEHAGDVERDGGEGRALHGHVVVADLVLDRVGALAARLRVVDVGAVGVDRDVADLGARGV